jgi:phage/plasmid-like protein (TIGR03299 family)
MADNINIKNGVASFASKQEIAWHKLGQVVDSMNSQEAIKLAQLDYTIEKRPLFINSINPITIEEAKKSKIISREFEYQSVINSQGELEKKFIPVYRPVEVLKDKYATVRTDINIPLGIVGSKYTVIQNEEAFDFMDSIIGKLGTYETCGALGAGETVFMTVKITNEMTVNKDVINQYLLLTMSHDGSSSIQIMYTPIRVVCNNTLTAAIRGNKNKVNVTHTKNAKVRLELAKQTLGLVEHNTLKYKDMFEFLGKKYISDNKAKEIIKKSLGIDTEINERLLSTRAQNINNMALSYYYNGIGQENIVGTAWGVFNGVTGYLQNVKSYKDADVKFKNSFLSGDVNVRTKTLELLIDV